jgi:hypothetical protein
MKKLVNTGPKPKKLVNTGPKPKKLDPVVLASALGAEIVGRPAAAPTPPPVRKTA